MRNRSKAKRSKTEGQINIKVEPGILKKDEI